MKIKLVVVLAALGLGFPLGACTIFRGPPTPFQTPTPNLTMTALFAVTLLPTQPPFIATSTPPLLATATQPPVQPTATSLPSLTPFIPTSTSLPPTATLPPATATATPGRPGGSYDATFMSNPPTLDGVWDEWTSRAYPANAIVFGAEHWAGPEDLEPSFRIGWNNNNLYVAVKVFDDKYVQNATGQDLFKGDSIEILFDNNLAGDFLNNTLNVDDYQLGISPGNPNTGGAKEAYLWYPADQAGSRNQVQIAAVSSAGLYRIEFAIPWSVLGVNPSQGQQFGFALSVSDNDNSNQNLQQTLASSARTRMLTNPTTWGVLTLK